MKRLLLVFVLIGALVPLAAHATIIGDYAGKVKGEPSSFLTFNVEKAGGKRKVRAIKTDDIPFDCEVGTPGDTQVMRIKGAFRVKRQKFRGTGEAILIGADPTGKFRGEFRRGGRAVGKIRLFGELDGVPGSDCDTGVLEWRADRTQSSPD